MATFSSINEALNALRDDSEFEVLASTLLLKTFPDIEPMGGTGDAGRDAVVRDGLFGGERARFQYSIEKRWPRKVRRELKRYTGEEGLKNLLFIFSVPTKPSTVDTLKNEAARLKLNLQIYGREWVRPRLEDRWDLAERFLNVTPRLPPRLVLPDDYVRSVAERVPGFDAALVGGVQRNEVIQSFYGDSKLRALLVLGHGGTGKTRAVLETLPGDRPSLVLRAGLDAGRELAAELPVHRDIVLVIDDAHGRPRLSEMQSILESEKWRGVKVVLTARPGYRELVRRSLGLPGSAYAEVTLTDLTRKEIDLLLRSPPHSIDDASIRLRLVKLAQSNPLIAHMAGCAVRATGIGVDTQSAFLREYCRLGRFSPRDRLVVGLVALVGSLSPSRDGELITTAFPGESLVDVWTSLRSLADEGLVQEAGEAFSVKPDILQPHLIADVLLPEKGPPPIDVKAVLRRMQYRQASVVERLAAATVIANGRGSELLSDLVRTTWPAPDSTSAGAWGEALGMVEAWGFALPQEVHGLLKRFIPVLRLVAGGIEPDRFAEPLSAAAGAARILALADPEAGVRALLEILAAGPDLDTDVEKNAALKQFHELAAKAATFEWKQVGARQEQLVAAIRRWVSSGDGNHVEPSASRAVALAASELIRVHFEYVEESPESGNRFTLGQFSGALTPELRKAVSEAAHLVGEALATLDERALSGVLDRLGRIEGIARNGMLPYAGTASSDARAELRTAVDHIVSCFASIWDDLPVAVRQRLVWFSMGRADASARARHDAELRRFMVFYPARDYGRNHDRWMRLVAGRARRLAAAVPGVEGLRLMEQALADGEAFGNAPGAWAFIDALERGLPKVGVEAAVTFCVSAPRLRPYAAQLLGNAVRRFTPDLDDLVWRLAREPGGDSIACHLLDAVQPATESKLVEELLLRGPAPLLEIAEHIERCSRLDAERKYLLLVSICERLSREQLARGLTILGTTARTAKGSVSPSLQQRITAQVVRLLSSTEVAGPGFIWFEPLFEMVASWESDAIVDVVLARARQLLSSRFDSGRHQQKLGKEIGKVVGSLSREQKRAVSGALAGWLQGSIDNPLREDDAVYDLLRCSMTADEFTALAMRWARDRATRHLAIGAIRGRCPSAEYNVVGRTLLSGQLSSEEESELLSAADLHGGMWGPLSTPYRERARFFEEWERDDALPVRRFGEKARKLFDERASREERQEFLEENR